MVYMPQVREGLPRVPVHEHETHLRLEVHRPGSYARQRSGGADHTARAGQREGFL